jgi:hypothetical protein
MQEITVYLRPGGNLDVFHPIENARAGEAIFWDFHSVDPQVQAVRVAFASGGAHDYFEARPGVTQHFREARVHNGHAQIVGNGPTLPSGPDRMREDKYTVMGLKKLSSGTSPIPGDIVSELDPIIIICDP